MTIPCGTHLGRYEILTQIGAGGMGEVYVAFDTRLKRRIAIKILTEADTSDKGCLDRFRKEAFATSSLNHPNILSIYDIDVADGTHFIVTELVEGQTLRSRLKIGRLTVADSLAIAEQMANALNAAHAVGVVHRDIKPENVMLRSDGYVKLLDFGIAKLINAKTDSITTTRPGVMIGTPLYMSPEQARGEPVDVRTDIWSLGVVLYEMLTGCRPFTGSTVTEVIKSILENEPLSFAAHDLQELPDLEGVVRSMLSKQLPSRYRQVAELLPHLQQLRKIRESNESSQRLRIFGPTNRFATTKPDEKQLVISDLSQNNSKKPYSRKRFNTVAVLPFVNASSDQKGEYLSDGVTETIINNLSQLPQLRVMSRNSVFRFKSKEQDPKVIGRELSVAAVVTGKLLRVGSRLLIQTELIDTEDGAQLWGESYNQKVSDIFKIQEDIANEISDKLQLKLTQPQKKRLAKRPTLDEQAYLSYLKGRFNWNKRSPEGLSLSINFFNEAIERDPMYALAYAGLADTYVVLGHQHLMLTGDAYSRAKAAAFRALEIDDALAEAHATLGFLNAAFDLDWSSSEKAFKKSIKLNSGYATAHQWYSAMLRAVGRTDEAISEALTANKLDPLSTSINVNVASCLFSARRYDEAIDRYHQISVFEPAFFWTHYGLALVYRATGRMEEAIAELQQALTMTADPGGEAIVIADLAYGYGVSGQREEAQRLINRLDEISRVRYVSPCDIAVSYLGLGDRDKAFRWLEKAYENHDAGLMWLKIDPVFDELRTDPRFLDLLVRVRLI